MRLAELPPLANVLACWDADPERLQAWAQRAKGFRPSVELWMPSESTLAARVPLPGAVDDHRRPHGLLFAEGAERFDGDTARALAAGADPGSFAGDFTFVHCSPAGLTAVASAGGLVPLWMWGDGTAAVVSSSLRWLLDVLPHRPTPDLLTCAMWASAQPAFPYGRSFFAGIRHLARGHMSRTHEGRWMPERAYWDERPEDGRVEHDPEAHAAELRHLLLDTLGRNLPEDAHSLLTLSGGVDSTALAAVAGAVLGRPLASFTITAPDPGVRARELRYVSTAAANARIVRRHEVVWTGELQQRLWERPREAAVPVVHPALLMLPQLHEQDPLAVLFGGEFADDVCGHWWRIQDWIDATGPLRLLAGLRRLPMGPSDLLRWPKGRWLSLRGTPRMNVQPGLLPFFRTDLRAEFAEWVGEHRARVAADPRPNRFLAAQLRLCSDGPLAQNWETTSLLGVRRLFPFHTREMLELGGRSDVREQLGPGTKRVMRRALAADVPAANLQRADKGQWGDVDLGFDPDWRLALPESVAAALEDPDHAPRTVDVNERLALQTLVDIGRAIH